MKADMLKKLLQAGALAAEAGSRGSAGNIASKIVDSGLDLSDWRKKNKKHDEKTNPNEIQPKPKLRRDEINPDMPK